MPSIDEPRPAVEAQTLTSGLASLDARLHVPGASAEPTGLLIVAHPHPAHGGNMDHPVVVETCARGAARGWPALRFDFRGVRESGGSTTDYLGHLDDWRTAVAWLRERHPDVPAYAAGFSYGARTLAAIAQPQRAPPFDVEGLLLLAPATRVPRTKRDFGNLLLGRPLSEARVDREALHNLGHLALPTQVLVGEDDVVAPHAELRQHLAGHATLQVLPGLNHFLSTRRGAGPLAQKTVGPALDRALDALRDARTAG